MGTGRFGAALGGMALLVALAATPAGAQAAPPRQPLPPPPGGQQQPPPPRPQPQPTPAVQQPVVQAPASQPTPATPREPSNGTSLPMAAGVVGGLALAGGAVALALSRRPRRVVAPEPAPVRSLRPVTNAAMQQLLEVSRRLTDVAASGDIDRAIVREAVGLVQSDGAALVRRQGDDLVLAAESDAGLVVTEVIADGAIRQAAETGQPIVQVSATEPAIRSLPAALAAVPLVNAGRVAAVLVVVRRSSEPFMPAERDALTSMAPVAAAAMQSAERARAAVEQSLIDPMTGVGNRRRFDAELADTLATSAMTSLCIVDLDHFKAVNDTYGHPAGDALLTAVAAVMRESIRPGDRLYRIGGEEFAIVFQDTAAAEATAVAERVRAAIADRTFAVGAEQALRATASLGIAATVDADAGELVACADSALYEAKESGRNRVTAAAGAPSGTPAGPPSW